MSMITNDWLDEIQGEFKKPYYKELYQFVRDEYSKAVIYPSADDIFNAMHFTPLSKVKVLLLGQDPYHNVNQAHGLSFSVLPEQKEIPPSLQNIYKELHDDLGCYIPNNGYLKKWADQGVLLLNTVLDCTCTSGKLPSGTWLGTVYGCNHPGCECTGQTDCIHAVGKTGTEQDTDADQSKASDPDSAASKPTVCVPGIFRMQAFQQGK